MWVARVVFDASKALLGSLAIENKVSLCGYPISFFKSKDQVLVYIVGLVFGEEDGKKGFVEGLRASDRSVNVENSGDFVVVEIKESPDLAGMYEHKILHLEPALVREDGKEFWVIGSWEKSDLMDFVDLVEDKYNAKLLSINQKEMSNFSMISIHPDITEKQKQALGLAIKKGYYDYPRKTSIEELAKLSGLSFSTYHAHLRKAEQKMLPYFFEHST
jgi:predicted DNA binding protein